MNSNQWTPELREAARKRSAKWWSSPQGLQAKTRLAERGKTAYQARWDKFAKEHPERAALIDGTTRAIAAGELVAPLCATGCGRSVAPAYDFEAVTVTGWKELCRSCWRDSHAQKQDSHGDESSGDLRA